MRDFAPACVFQNQLDLLSLDVKARLDNAPDGAAAQEIISGCELRRQAPCVRHATQCQLVRADLNLFGAPCVDDSPMGSRSMDDGISRRASQNQCFQYIFFNIWIHTGVVMS